MYNHYQSDYPNQVHQLLVTVSKHLFIGAKGQIRHQWKQMDVSLKTLHKSDREHLIHYFLRDHFSGVYYVELVSSKQMIPLQDFLLRAWMERSDLRFAGIPTALMIPKAVEDYFPSAATILNELGVQMIYPPSGFASGIRDLPVWEEISELV